MNRPNTPFQRMLTIPEVADRLHLSSKTIRRAIDAKALAAHRLGRTLRVSEDDLRRFLDQRRG